VKNIQKITMAMKMVAASKLRTVQVKAENSRGLFQPFTVLLGDAPAITGKKTLVVTLSTDKGLCGGINSTVVKYSRSLLRLNQSYGEGHDTKFVIIGEKAKLQLQRDSKKYISTFISETQKVSINFTQVAMIADEIIKNNEYDVIKLVYNKFNSAVSFLPTVATLLSPEMLAGEEEQKIGNLESYETEGSETQGEVLQNLAEFQLASVLYNALLENATSEMGARMSAMDNSTRNAGEVLDRLTLSYNRSRQASITTELIEIISGAAALEG
jgi:F-type H+-transporting ATPase subunit gamma